MTLSDYDRGTNNNFNLIRLLAAFSVLLSHSALLLGVSSEWARLYSLGGYAVNVFFVASGFLVTGSLLKRHNIIEFIWARLLRIFPAIWAMLVLTAVGIGSVLTTLSIHDYFASPVTTEYLWRCATLVNGIRYSLPGVFETNPYKGIFNGSLWTLPLELRLYGSLAAAWIAFSVASKWRLGFFRIAVPATAVILLCVLCMNKFIYNANYDGNINSYMFFAGGSLCVLKNKLSITNNYLILLIFALIISLINSNAFFICYNLALAPLTIHLVYLPGGAVRKFNLLGDYSYGVYIYAYPIQQTLVALDPAISLWQMIVFSTLATFVLAALSWHILEKRVLAHKNNFAAATLRILDFGRSKMISLRPQKAE